MENILVISSAMGVTQDFYKNIAQYLLKNNITVVTFDYTGIGSSLSGKIKECQATLLNWGIEDLNTVLKYCLQKFKNIPLSILGHSIGGSLIGLSQNSIHAKTIILTCTQSGYWGHWSGFSKIKMWSYWNILFPILIDTIGYMPSRLFSPMHNLPKNVAKDWNLWCNSKTYLFQHIDSSHQFYSKYNSKLISYSVSDDEYAPKKAVDWLVNKFRNIDRISIHISPDDYNQKRLGHFGLFNIKLQDTFWVDIRNDILD